MIRIGICDDELLFRNGVCALLEKYGKPENYVADCFDNGDSLIDAHTKSPYDIIFLDVVMQLFNGIEVAREIREQDKNVRIVFPQFSALSLYEVELGEASFVSPQKPKKKMFFYGDSITQGYDAQYPSNKYTALTALALGVESFNKAIGGEVFQPGLAAAKSNFYPDYISVAYGTNDCATRRGAPSKETLEIQNR